MNLMKKAGLLFSFVMFSLLLLFMVAPPPLEAQGQIPFTQDQFPVWYATQTQRQQAVSNASELVLFQTALPRYFMGNNGYLQFNLFAGSPDAAAATVTHSITCYIGGTNAAIGAVWGSGSTAGGGSVPIFTNTFTTTAGQPIEEYLAAYNSSVTNYFYGTTTTNSLSAGDYRRLVTVGTQTNGLLLTITGVAGGTGGATNIVNLDSVVLKSLIIP